MSRCFYNLKCLPGKPSQKVSSPANKYTLLNSSVLSKQEGEILFYASIFLLFIIGLGVVIIVLLQPIRGIQTPWFKSALIKLSEQKSI